MSDGLGVGSEPIEAVDPVDDDAWIDVDPPQPDWEEPDGGAGNHHDDRASVRPLRRLRRPGHRRLRTANLAGQLLPAAANSIPIAHNAPGPEGDTDESKIEQRLKSYRIDREARRRLKAEEQPPPALLRLLRCVSGSPGLRRRRPHRLRDERVPTR
jgi:hypothetical protein